jgi:hypothetical protein
VRDQCLNASTVERGHAASLESAGGLPRNYPTVGFVRRGGDGSSRAPSDP